MNDTRNPTWPTSLPGGGAAAPSSSPNHPSRPGSPMDQRLFWGTPHTDTDVNAFETAARARAHDVAAGKYAAATLVDQSLEQIARRSIGLVVFATLLAMVMMLLAYQTGSNATALFTQLNRWGFVMVMASCLLLLPNLGLMWAADARVTYADPRQAYLFSMKAHKSRAARYTIALWLIFVATVMTLLSVARFS
jgi:hypothetical protein